MQMPPPTLGMFEAPGHFPDGAREAVHRQKVRVHAVRGIEPLLLALMSSQRPALLLMDRSRVHKSAGDDFPPQFIAQSVRQGVINRDISSDGIAARDGLEIWHATSEG